MYKKYLASTVPGNLTEASASIITNDLYLAAFLHCLGCTLDHLEQNERRRKSFVFTGERVRELREAYRTGPVRLDMRSFRESLFHIRRLMDGSPEQRSVSHAAKLNADASEQAMQAVPQL
jgi:hypothetical protein